MVAGTDDCWLWQIACDRDGYGVLTGPHQNQLRAHRVSYEIANGPIPDGLHVLHTCDRPPCVNPAHLFLGTEAENKADKMRKGRQPRGELVSRSKLTDAQAVEIRQRYARGKASLRDMAVEYGVHPNTLSKLVCRETYKHLP